MITLLNFVSKSKTIILEPGLTIEFVICSGQKSISVIENDHYCLLEFDNAVKITYDNNRVQINKQFMVNNLQSCTIEKPLKSNNLRLIKISFSSDWVNANGFAKYFALNTFPSSFSCLPLFFNRESIRIFESFNNGKAPAANAFSIKCLVLTFLNNYLNMIINPESTTNVELKLDWVVENYFSNFENPTPKLSEISLELNLSKSKFNQLFRNRYGKSFHQCYQQWRMNKSYEWLKSGKFKVTTVSKKLGYSHPTKFIQQFKKQFGKTPHKFVKGQKFTHLF